MFVLRNKETGKFVKNKYFELTEELQKARAYGRRCDASNSLNYQIHHAKHSEWEILPVTLTLGVLKTKETEGEILGVTFYGGDNQVFKAHKFYVLTDDKNQILSVQAVDKNEKVLSILNNVMNVIWIQKK